MPLPEFPCLPEPDLQIKHNFEMIAHSKGNYYSADYVLGLHELWREAYNISQAALAIALNEVADMLARASHARQQALEEVEKICDEEGGYLSAAEIKVSIKELLK